MFTDKLRFNLDFNLFGLSIKLDLVHPLPPIHQASKQFWVKCMKRMVVVQVWRCTDVLVFNWQWQCSDNDKL